VKQDPAFEGERETIDMSAAKRNPPFRAEHCGSLLRPQELVQKRYDVAAGKATQADLEPLEDKAIAEVVKMQKDCGFHVISSGEYARHMFWGQQHHPFSKLRC
jgi:methionine synthase II (cobalamin-independent)